MIDGYSRLARHPPDRARVFILPGYLDRSCLHFHLGNAGIRVRADVYSASVDRMDRQPGRPQSRLVRGDV